VYYCNIVYRDALDAKKKKKKKAGDGDAVVSRIFTNKKKISLWSSLYFICVRGRYKKMKRMRRRIRSYGV
jgi:hypothetical protein